MQFKYDQYRTELIPTGGDMPEREVCGIIPPRQDKILNHEFESHEYTASCIRVVAHNGPHLILTPSGKYIAWEDDDDCGCCSPEEDDRCCVYWPVTNAKELQKLLDGRD